MRLINIVFIHRYTDQHRQAFLYKRKIVFKPNQTSKNFLLFFILCIKGSLDGLLMVFQSSRIKSMRLQESN